MSDEPRVAGKPPGDRSHLQRLIDKWAQDPETPATVRRLQNVVSSVVIVGLIEGLVDDNGRPQLALKGGRALELRFGLKTRASGDFDAACRGTIEEALRRIGDASASGWQGFTGILGPPEDITRPGITPPPVRVPLKTGL
jgi:hypothetical protein